jgi:lipopolysaccharide exporter
MSGIRRALFFASAERYVSFFVSFATVATVSRLLTPTEIGSAALGMVVIAIANALKEFAASGFLVQGEQVERSAVRTAFTVQLAITLLIAAGIVLAAPKFAGAYHEPMLVKFFDIMAVSLISDSFSSPILSLLRRELAFGALAIINIANFCVTGAVTITLAALGFGFMSVAWSALAATITMTSLSIAYRPDLGTFRPSLKAWRQAVAFGGYHGAITVLHRVYEGLPQLVLGRLLPLDLVGLYNRATVMSGLADKLILSSIFNVAFPALAAEARTGRNLKYPLLTSYCYITAFYWPTLILIALLADPIVRLVLGAQWYATVPLIQIMAVANLFWFPVALAQPLLLAIGAMRDAFVSSLIALSVSALLLCGASVFGVKAMAASQFLTTPFQMYIVLTFIRRHVTFSWREFLVALRPSAIVSLYSVLPALVVMGLGDISTTRWFYTASGAVVASLCGWTVGILLTKHPVRVEIHRMAMAAGRRIPAARLVGRLFAANAGL